jgi:putative membrane protein
MKIGIRIASILGFCAMIALIAAEGAGAIAQLLAGAGLRLLLLVPLQTVPLLLDVLGWRSILPAQVRVPALFSIACIRQAINRLLPVANVGGEIASVRLLARQGVPAATAGASILVELMLALFAQYLFVAIGVICLCAGAGGARIIQGLVVGLAAALPPLLLMLVFAQRGRIFQRIEVRMSRLLGPWIQGSPGIGQGARVDAAVRESLAAHGRVSRALGWQLAGLVAGCSETWLALRWLGHGVSPADALVLESLTQAARSVLFMVPSALGVQEAGLIGAGMLVGLAPDAALALSLAKRMREVLFGLPWLLTWQWMEGRTLFLQLRRRDEP